MAEKCEWCHKKDVELEIHHVKKLKDLKGKKRWEKRIIERNRKTIALCKKCHVDLHDGKCRKPYALRGVRTVRGGVLGNLT